MPLQPPAVYVIGATGTQGSAVCRQLLQHGWPVRATARDTTSPAAQKLAGLGVQLNMGGWDDDASLAVGLKGCSKIYLCLAPSIHNLDEERVWATRLLRAARAAGVDQVVYSSAVSADAPEKRNIPDDHMMARALFVKNAIEGMVQRAGFERWTILRPGFFMANMLDPKVRIYHELFEADTWLTAYTRDTKIGLVDPEDIAKFAVAAFREPARFDQQGIEVVSEKLTPGRMMELLSNAVGREMKAEFYTEEKVAAGVKTNPLMAVQVMLRDSDRFTDLDRIKAWGIPLGTFEAFLEREEAAVKETYN